MGFAGIQAGLLFAQWKARNAEWQQ